MIVKDVVYKNPNGDLLDLNFDFDESIIEISLVNDSGEFFLFPLSCLGDLFENISNAAIFNMDDISLGFDTEKGGLYLVEGILTLALIINDDIDTIYEIEFTVNDKFVVVKSTDGYIFCPDKTIEMNSH